MKTLVSLLFISLSLSVFAATGSKYEILKNSYETAKEVPSALDFEEYVSDEDMRTQGCVTVGKKHPDEFGELIIARYKMLVPETPGNGPMFPGSPESVMSKVLVGTEGVFKDISFPIFLNKTTETDFIVHVQENDENIYSDIGGNVNIYIRKSKNYFPFKAVKFYPARGPKFPAKKSVLVYGYCFNK